MALLLQFLCGLIFGLGLMLAGMADPAKVLAFLDIAALPAGGWDPSLAFVMVGAIAVTFIGYRMVWRRAGPLFGGAFHLPNHRNVDLRVIAGPAIFGVGWGVAGICPGPAIVGLVLAPSQMGIFVLFMLVGMGITRILWR